MIVFGSPSRYVQGPGALKQLGVELVRIGPGAAIIVDPLVHEAYGALIEESCVSAGVQAFQVRFSGECTPAEIDRLSDEVGDASVIAAAGGGKCIDAGKAVADRRDGVVVTIPTIASTDAPTSHNYVLYDENHSMLSVGKLKRNPALVLVDTQVIACAPQKLFAAGIGDAIGKIYEVEACYNAGGVNILGGESSWAAVELSRACHRLLLSEAEAAMSAIQRKAPDSALERVVEGTILLSGLAFESGGLSIAHSMTRGLTAIRPFSGTPHGFQVAYANLVQLRLEGRPEREIHELAGFYSRVGLPRSLMELAGEEATPEAMDIIAARTMTGANVVHFPYNVSADDIRTAMIWVEKLFGFSGSGASSPG
ncbi:MAG: glycerol dehydrogenase [Pikeienuella sp.]